MALSTRLELRQGQQLVMTPQLQQAIKLLQLSNLELSQFVENELERNPLLERQEGPKSPVRSRFRAKIPLRRSTFRSPPGRALNSAYDTDAENIYPDTAPPTGRAKAPRCAGMASRTGRVIERDGGRRQQSRGLRFNGRVAA